MSADPDCLFCKIVAGEIPADVVRETETTLAFRDVEAQAPTHVLVVPKQHLANAAEVGAADKTLLARLVSEAASVAESEGVDGYRLVFNTGASANQSVFHAHLHLLGGRQMTWPPG